MRPVLYSFRRCPYAMRARLAIDVSGIEVEHREILLRDKPQAMLDASPKGTVPVVVLPDGQVIEESLDVMNWALDQNDPENWRAPGAVMDALIAENDGPFKQALDRYKYATRYEDADPLEERAKGEAFLRELDTRLKPSPCLFGDKPSQADYAIFPFVRQFANADRDWFDAQDFHALQTWLGAHLKSRRFLRVMTKYPLWKANPS